MPVKNTQNKWARGEIISERRIQYQEARGLQKKTELK